MKEMNKRDLEQTETKRGEENSKIQQTNILIPLKGLYIHEIQTSTFKNGSFQEKKINLQGNGSGGAGDDGRNEKFSRRVGK